MKFKINKKYILIIIALVIFGGVIYYSTQTFKPINTDKFNDLVKSKGMNIIYIGRETCGECREVKPILEEVLKSKKLKVYYYDTKKAKKREYDKLKLCIDNLKIETVPLILCYKDGKEVARFDYDDYEKSKDDSIAKFIENISKK